MDTNIKIKTLCYMVIAFLILRYVYFVGVTGYKGLSDDFLYINRDAHEIAEFKKDSSEAEIYKLLIKENDFIIYFPLFYLSLIPLFKMGYSSASIVWLLFNQLALLVSLVLLIKAVKPKLSLIEFTIVVFIVTNFLPLIHNIIGGQTNFLLLLSLAGCLYFLKKKKDFLSGVFLAFGILLKWLPVVFLIFLVIKKRYRCIFSCLLFLIVMFLISISLLGLRFHYMQLFTVLPLEFMTLRGVIINHSLFIVFQRLFRLDYQNTKGILHLPFLANFFSIFSVLMILSLTVRRLYALGREMKESFSFEFAFFVSLILLIPHVILIFHLTLALIPLLIAFLNLEKIKPWSPLFIASFLLLGLEYWPDGLTIFRQGWGVIFLSGRTLGMFLLWLGYFLVFSKKDTFQDVTYP